jgi:hypothetical protein
MRSLIEPDRAALVFAHQQLRIKVPLDDAIQHPAYILILKNVARRHMQRRDRLDVKKLQANDHE